MLSEGCDARRVNKSQAGKELAKAYEGAYLWCVANSDRVCAACSLDG
jgi:hypothetical protein